MQLQAQLTEQQAIVPLMARNLFFVPDYAPPRVPIRAEVRRQVEALEKSLSKVSPGIDATALSKADDLRVRLAKAVAANARQNHNDALKIVTDQDERAEAISDPLRIEPETAVNQVRGDAFYGTQRWEKALERYEKILAHRPHDWPTRTIVARCLYHLGRLDETHRRFDEIVAHYQAASGTSGETVHERNLAVSLGHRGYILHALRKNKAAVADYDRVVPFFERLVETENRHEYTEVLSKWYVLRGRALRDVVIFDRAAGDLDKAIRLFTRLVNEEGRTYLRGDLAAVLMDRGVLAHRSNANDRAMRYYNHAVALYTQLVHEQGRDEYVAAFVETLNDRGLAQDRMTGQSDAVRDYTQAIELGEELIEHGGRPDLWIGVAKCYNNRGLCWRFLNRLDKSVDDYDKAIEIYRRMVEEQGRKDLSKSLYLARNNRSVAVRHRRLTKKN